MMAVPEEIISGFSCKMMAVPEEHNYRFQS